MYLPKAFSTLDHSLLIFNSMLIVLIETPYHSSEKLLELETLALQV